MSGAPTGIGGRTAPKYAPGLWEKSVTWCLFSGPGWGIPSGQGSGSSYTKSAHRPG